MNDSSELKMYALLYKNVKGITIYYVLLFMVATVMFVFAIFIEYSSFLVIDKIPLAVFGCSATSLLGSVIYYIRKIYLISILNNVKPQEEFDNLEKWGTILYFLIRPFFSVIISVIVVIGLSSGIFAFFISDGTLSKSFVDFSMVIAFFLGVSNGTLVDKIDKIGKSFIGKIFD